MPKSLVKAHRLLAILLGGFLVTHFAVHFSALGGAQQHLTLLKIVQGLYQNPIVEPLLILAIVTQLFLGVKLVGRRWKQPQKGFWSWAQIISGLYLAFFFILHTSAALITRHLVGLETNFYWVAGTLKVAPLQYFFFPYYFLGVLSVFTHFAAAIYFGWPQKGAVIAKLLVLLGAVAALIIVSTFGGALYPIDLPTDYTQYYGID